MTNSTAEKQISLKKIIKPAIQKKAFSGKNEQIIKKQTEKSKNLPMFCTECDRELNYFWLTEKASNKNSVKENFENCNRTGKFKGHYCSKMFISGVYEEKVLKKKK
jgi:hypothetical protein